MQHRGLVLVLLLVGSAWGLTAPLAKLVVEGGYRHFGIIFWQLVIGIVAMGGWLLLTRRGLPFHRAALIRYGFVAAIGAILPNASFFVAQEGLPAGLVAIFIALVPMFALPMALAAGLERAEPVRILGLLAGLAGTLMIVLPDAALPDRAALIFVPFALAAAFFYALEAVGLGWLGDGGVSAVQIFTGASLIGLVPALLLALATGSAFAAPWPLTTPEIAMIATALLHAAAYVGYVWMVGRGGAVFAAQCSYLITGTGILWSMLLLGERYSPWVFAALVAVMGGLFLVQPRAHRRQDAVRVAPPAAAASIGTHDAQDS